MRVKTIEQRGSNGQHGVAAERVHNHRQALKRHHAEHTADDPRESGLVDAGYEQKSAI